MNKEEIIKLSLEADELTRLFRHNLHRIPELAMEENKTASYIREVLDSYSIPYSCVKTGTIVDIINNEDSLFIAFRADIDALQIDEPNTLEFASEHKGFMHACGHDCHAAMLLATAIILWKNKDKLSKNIRLIFQPAEEALGGANMLIDAGCLNNVKEIYCLHMVSKLDVGRFMTKEGIIHASSDGFIIRIYGKAAHGASPQNGIDAIVIASNIILSLQTLISRETSSYDSAVLTIGKIQGGKARNIVCDEVTMDGTLRTLSSTLREKLIKRIDELCQSIAKSYNGFAKLEIVQSYYPCYNDSKKTKKAISILKELYGEDTVVLKEKPSMGGEDFGSYERLIPGCKLYLGTGCLGDIHTSSFCVNEDTLHYGVGFFLAVAYSTFN